MKYKVLMFNGVFVNELLLNKGIYGTNIPTLKDIDYSIEQMEEDYKLMSSFTASEVPSNVYLSNLRQCELVVVDLIVDK